MNTVSGSWRACLVGLALRSAGTTLGLLFVAVLTATVASAQTADLAVTQTADANPVVAGNLVTTAITVTNNGPSAADNVALVDLFPPDTFTNMVGAVPAGWSCALGVNSVECTIPTLAASASATFHPGFGAISQTPTGAILVNDAIVTSTTVDPNLANNLASVATTINPGGTPASPSDLAVTKTGPATALPGEIFTYTITLTNNGPNGAGVPSINEATPPNTTFVSLTSPALWTCNSPAVGRVGRVECFLPSGAGLLASGATATITLTVQAQARTPNGAITTNVVTVEQNTSPSVDPTLTNNRVTLSTVIQGPTATPLITATATATPTSTTTPATTPTVTPTPTPAGIPGDFSGDGLVDIRDYGMWRQNFGQGNCGNPADANGDCLVDIRDYGLWRQHFGEGTPADRRGGPLRAGAAPVPRGTPGLALLGRDQASAGSWAPQAEGSGPAVPIVPLVGGLLGLGGLARWRVRRPRHRE